MALMTYQDEPVELWDVYTLRETPKAILALIDNGEFWLPKSVICEGSDVLGEGDEGVLMVKYWWAKKHGLVD